MLAEHAMAAPEGLPSRPTVEILVLRTVFRHTGLTVSDLVAKLDIAQSRISQVVAGLEREGLLRRNTDRSDRRRQRIVSTARFKKDVERRMMRNAEQALEPLLAQATPRERERVLKVLPLVHELILRAAAREGVDPSSG